MKQPGENLIKRRVTLPDGRYLIFYTFTPQDPPVSSAKSEEQITHPKNADRGKLSV